MNIPLFILIISIAAFIQTSAGFGFAMVALSIISLFLPMLTGSVIAVLSMLPLTTYIAIKNRSDINWGIFTIPFICSVIATQIGIRLLMVMDNAVLLKLLGIALIGFSLFSFFSKSALSFRASLPNKVFFGTLSGIFSGLFTMGGPPIAIYMLATSQGKNEYNSTLQLYFLATSLISAATHWFYGNITHEVLSYLGFAYLGVLMGTLFGRKMFQRLSAEKMRKLVYGVMIAMGFFVLLR